MVIRCPNCKFTGTLTEKSRLAAADVLYCPRCQTPMSFAEPVDLAAASGAEAELQPQPHHKVDWEARTSWLDLIAFWRTSKNILFRPAVTFTTLNYGAGIRSSLVYLLVYGSLGQIIGRYWFTLLGIMMRLDEQMLDEKCEMRNVNYNGHPLPHMQVYWCSQRKKSFRC